MSNMQNKNYNIKKILLILVSMLILFGLASSIFILKTKTDSKPVQTETTNHSLTETSEPNSDSIEEKENLETVLLTAVGDIMFHDDQLASAIKDDHTYDFHSMFADVKPIFREADVTLANFETTLAGDSLEFVGYPRFNSPDEVADAIKDAGVDILTTANNHSLDTGDDGLKRTARVLQDKHFKTVGTYENKPDSRVLTHEVNGITFAILAYTESTNGLGDQYDTNYLNEMINLMTKENIERDIEEAKQMNVDFIITFMHWGEEYMTEPNDTQKEYAKFMADQGVDLILGSHPHVIQHTDTIVTDEKETFVAYSMGNFISNQRVETLGEDFARTEDGVILNFTIEKDIELDETTITDVDFIPTWVYKAYDAKEVPQYRVLPIDEFLNSGDISDAFKSRMERSYEETMSQMNNK